jgi:hypothetical protein
MLSELNGARQTTTLLGVSMLMAQARACALFAPQTRALMFFASVLHIKARASRYSTTLTLIIPRR